MISVLGLVVPDLKLHGVPVRRYTATLLPGFLPLHAHVGRLQMAHLGQDPCNARAIKDTDLEPLLGCH